jgi:hypothetical protein
VIEIACASEKGGNESAVNPRPDGGLNDVCKDEEEILVGQYATMGNQKAHSFLV